MPRWIRPSTRLAVYLRDGWTCAYCGADGRAGAVLVLEHLHPRVLGGGNEPSNLVTACWTCNDRRRHLPVWRFVADLHDPDEVRREIRNRTRRQLPRAEARRLAASPPPWLLALRRRADTRGRHEPAPEPRPLAFPPPVAPPPSTL